MTGTFHTPLGKVRIASMRRYILLRMVSHTADKPTIIRRSDTRATLERLARSGDYILDTAERKAP